MREGEAGLVVRLNDLTVVRSPSCNGKCGEGGRFKAGVGTLGDCP